MESNRCTPQDFSGGTTASRMDHTSDDDDGDADDSPVLRYLRPEGSLVPRSKREAPEMRSMLIGHLPAAPS